MQALSGGRLARRRPGSWARCGKRLLAGLANRDVVIKADRTLPLEFVVRAMAAARDAGAAKLLLATQHPPPQSSP